MTDEGSIVLSLVQKVVIKLVVIDPSLIVVCLVQILHGYVVLHAYLPRVHFRLLGHLVQTQSLLKLFSSTHDPFLLDIARQLVVRLLDDIMARSPPQEHIKDEFLHNNILL